LDAWWCATRTEALARVMIEAESKEQMDRLAEGIVGAIRTELGV